jgi:uncharacterized protein YcgI (DUF1989 family)
VPEATWGELVEEILVPPGYGRAYHARAGDYIGVTDVEGAQIGDFVAFNSDNPEEKLDGERTRSGLTPMRAEVEPGVFQDYWKTNVYLRVGDEISSNMRNPLLRLVADPVGVNDFIFAPCDLRLYQDVYGVKGYHRNCLDSLAEALEPLGIGRWQIPAPINVFQNTPVRPDGTLGREQAQSKPGDTLVFEALQNLVGALSSCPMDLSPVNAGRITPLKLSIWRRS